MSYGHSFVVHGELNGVGNIHSRQYAGRYPVAETQLVVGQALAVPAIRSANHPDRDERRVTASF